DADAGHAGPRLPLLQIRVVQIANDHLPLPTFGLIAEHFGRRSDLRELRQRIVEADGDLADGLAEIGQRVDDAELAVMQDGDGIGDTFDFRDLVTRQQYGTPSSDAVEHALEKLTPHEWIKP